MYLVYISLFHNGIRWGNDEFQPLSVNEVFFWSRTPDKDGHNFSDRLGVYQDSPLSSVMRIKETLQGKCVGIKTDIFDDNMKISGFTVDFRCTLENQRGNLVGYFGESARNPTDKNITDFTSILSLYRVVFSEILFYKQ